MITSSASPLRSTLRIRSIRLCRTFSLPRASSKFSVVTADDQVVAQGLGPFEKPDVPVVEQVECPVRDHPHQCMCPLDPAK